ncbi:MAG: response regulator [Kofleriaceae bacterium]|nr:response regulator [Myxococcales bacterium]MCB9559232.1 response regulator [Kofleriaceae bacterium]MCB9574876.1 response regulator [Kofleriaceae bacterium]
MAAPSPVTSVVLIAARAALDGPLRPVLAMLDDVAVPYVTVDTTEDAAARLLLGERDQVPCVLVDVGDVARGEAPVTMVESRLRSLREMVPWAAPVLVARAPSTALVLAGMRSGAVDLLDVEIETAGTLWHLLGRIAAVHHDRQAQRKNVAALRAMIEEMLRDLVKTERRSIDLEHRLAMRDRPSGPVEVGTDLDATRPPILYVVEDDRDVADQLVDALEEAGLTTFAFISGEEAVAQGERMANRGEAIDLLLCDLRLPGIDGLETVRRIRTHKPGLAAFLMTGYSDVEAATSAADLGVVGFVLKPFDDLRALVTRIKEQAQAAMQRTREHHYLQRIKERHDHVLQRYRKLAAEIDR